MDQRFAPHNSHLSPGGHFRKKDPQLKRLYEQPYIYKKNILDQISLNTPGIYSVGGGRQVGKSTLLKLWMEHLLAKKINPQAIFFFSGELIDDHHQLLLLLTNQLSSMPNKGIKYILLDEVTYIKDWDKTIKYAADSGMLDEVILIITGSDLLLMQEARMRFPGRRGKASKVDFHLYPLSFKEFLSLKDKKKFANLAKNPSPAIMKALYEAFDQYLIHGGYLTAINDYATYGYIPQATLMTYSDWIRGDMVKKGKQEGYLKEVLGAILKRYGSQLSWNSLADDLSIDHPTTVADYINLLESMDALFVQYALLEHKLVAAPKKARKVICNDPFIFHAIRAWVKQEENPYETQILPLLENPNKVSTLVESIVTSHYRRYYPTYYIKSTGEVDVAYVDQDRFWPIEIKWQAQKRPKDLKQITKYNNGKIYTKSQHISTYEGCEEIPLPLALARM